MYIRLGSVVSEFRLFGIYFPPCVVEFLSIILFRELEPTRCVLQVVLPILSLRSVAILKSPPIMVFWVLFM